MSITKRLEWPDYVKAICMIFIILSHSGYITDLCYRIYTPFFLSSYFFISGFFFLKKTSWQSKLNGIITSLFIPYVIYWIISFGVDKAIHNELNVNSLVEFGIFFYNGNKLWFLSCLIIVELIAWAYFYLMEKLNIYIYIILSLTIFFLMPQIQMPWYFNISFLAGFFFGLGILANKHIEIFNKITDTDRIGYLSIILFITLIVIDYNYKIQNGSFNREFENYPFFIVESIVSIVSIIYLCKKLKNQKWLLYIGYNSLLYYFFQNQILNISRYIGRQFEIQKPDFIYSVISTIFVILFLIIPINLVNKYFKIMSGKYKFNIIKSNLKTK